MASLQIEAPGVATKGPEGLLRKSDLMFPVLQRLVLISKDSYMFLLARIQISKPWPAVQTSRTNCVSASISPIPTET